MNTKTSQDGSEVSFMDRGHEEPIAADHNFPPGSDAWDALLKLFLLHG